MKALHPAAFPALRLVFSGYLHEDFAVEYGSPEQAVAAFLADASDVERRRFAKEARRFLRATASVEFEKVRQLIEQMGSRWIPESHAALVAALEPSKASD